MDFANPIALEHPIPLWDLIGKLLILFKSSNILHWILIHIVNICIFIYTVVIVLV